MLPGHKVSQVREQVSSTDYRGGADGAAREDLRQEGEGLLISALVPRTINGPPITRFLSNTRPRRNSNRE